MRTMILPFIAALTFAASAASAQDASITIDLDAVCVPGCVVVLNVESTRFVNGDFHGEFPAAVVANPMQAFQAVVLSDSSGMRFTLGDYPGRPTFGSLPLATKFLEHDKDMTRAARAAAGS